MVEIIHCDMDAFYASVEQLRDPSLCGKPVVVGGSPQSRGVVSTCSYEARKYGVRSAMPLAEAYRRCPQAVFLSPDFALYQETSRKMHQVFSDYTPLIEPLSLDEAFLDVTGSREIFGDAALIAQTIKRRIKNELGLTVSVGVAPNKFLAKLASDLSKPDGFLVVDPDKVQELLDPLDIRRVWGIGEKTAETLYRQGIRTIKDLRNLEESYLLKLLGLNGIHLYQLARGIDYRPVEVGKEAKSIGRETTFAADVSSLDFLEKTLLDLAGDVARSLRRAKLKGQTITLKIKYHDFQTVSRSVTIDNATALDDVIYSEAQRLLKNLVQKPVRLLGVSVHNLADAQERQLSLFSEGPQPQEALSQTIDRIKDKFGEKSITRARLLDSNKRY